MPRNPAISYAYKTAVFRIHNPSRHKRAMLYDALTRNQTVPGSNPGAPTNVFKRLRRGAGSADAMG